VSPPSAPVAAPTAPAAAMLDDEARVRLEAWLHDLSNKNLRSPQIIAPGDVATQAGVPEQQVVSLLVGVAREHAHIGVTARQLQGGQFHLDIGPARIRQVRSRDGWEV
jgi:hypothetical protein